MLTTEQAASELGVSRARVLVLIRGREAKPAREGKYGSSALSPKLAATEFGGVLMIHRDDVEALAAADRPAHRPRSA